MSFLTAHDPGAQLSIGEVLERHGSASADRKRATRKQVSRQAPRWKLSSILEVTLVSPVFLPRAEMGFMYRALLFAALVVMGNTLVSFADGPDTGARPPDFGLWEVPPAPAVGEAASGWIFLSHPHARFWTPLYHLPGGVGERPAVCLWIEPKGSTDADVYRAFDSAPRLFLSIQEDSRTYFVSIASGDILPVNGRLVKFERAKFPADYPQASIPKNVMQAGLQWTDVTAAVPVEVQPGSGWPLVLATSDPDKRSGQHRFDYKLFPDPDLNKVEIHRLPFHVRVAAIMPGSTEGKKPQADIEIISKARWIPSPGDDLPQVQENTVQRMFVHVGQSIWHDQRAYRVLKIVPAQDIPGEGNLIGWIEIESQARLVARPRSVARPN